MTPNYLKFLNIAGIVFLLSSPLIEAKAVGNSGTDNAAATRSVPLKVGVPLLQARARILKSGRKPVPMHQTDGYEYDGTEKQLVQRHIVEVEFCTLDAGVLCTFYYIKNATGLRVETIGEKVSYMTVVQWTNECPKSFQ
ncbi:hypothetical protein G4G28_20890 [Massilia sp. Dwa41.01b]|uniref:hypothetical protein n=1 Tax=unclassified Massilia TaxID=2609279 RepID=UPI001603F5A2|nr:MULTISPECIES: hypothetical protein [unclassified Massilia]QNA90343.1 hypothetical protein G4G28_20890 [Massilia sp. Dwa41.01b]QNB01244.1 hypothetical protein G4G31_24520 [Massilia sp. Se16.2.3]